jgi:tetratricopeptide (TPR) repeat protein
VQVSSADRARLNTPPTASADALAAYWRGRALLERLDAPGNLERSVVAFNEALRLDGRFLDAHVALAEAYWELYNATRDATSAELALASGRNALQLAPDQPSVRFAYARGLADSGRNAEAVDELQRALAQQPGNDEARRQLGRALAALGRLDEAVAEWRKAIAARPGNWPVYSDMGRALYQGARYPEAREVLEQLTRLQPDNVIGFQLLGTVHHAVGDTDAALANYEKANAITPAAQVLSNIGTIYHQRRAYRQAREAYMRAIALRPRSAQTHRNLGDTLMRMGEDADARRAYRTAAELVDDELAVNPTNALNLASSAVYLQKAGE